MTDRARIVYLPPKENVILRTKKSDKIECTIKSVHTKGANTQLLIEVYNRENGKALSAFVWDDKSMKDKASMETVNKKCAEMIEEVRV